MSLTGLRGRKGRLDVVAIWTTSGYKKRVINGFEVKATRADLLADLRARKWQKYTKQVTRLYFACPEEIVSPQEIPLECGLLLYRNGDWRYARGARKMTERPGDDTTAWRLLWRLHEQLEQERNNADRS